MPLIAIHVCICFLSLTVHFISTVTVTWNGTTISSPVLIYQDDIVTDNRDVLATPVMDGTLICRSENQARVGWHFANGGALTTSPDFHFRQIRTEAGVTPSVSRLSANGPNQMDPRDLANGLWSCRLDSGVSGAVSVGVFVRGGGEVELLLFMHVY